MGAAPIQCKKGQGVINPIQKQLFLTVYLNFWLNFGPPFRALVYELLVEFEQQLIFKVSRAHPASLISEQQSSTAEESLAGGRGR